MEHFSHGNAIVQNGNAIVKLKQFSRYHFQVNKLNSITVKIRAFHQIFNTKGHVSGKFKLEFPIVLHTEKKISWTLIRRTVILSHICKKFLNIIEY